MSSGSSLPQGHGTADSANSLRSRDARKWCFYLELSGEPAEFRNIIGHLPPIYLTVPLALYKTGALPRSSVTVCFDNEEECDMAVKETKSKINENSSLQYARIVVNGHETVLKDNHSRNMDQCIEDFKKF